MAAPLVAKAPAHATLAVVPSVVEPDADGLAATRGGPAGMSEPSASFQVASELGALLRALTEKPMAAPFAMLPGAWMLVKYCVPTGSDTATGTICFTPPTKTTYCSIALPPASAGFFHPTRKPASSGCELSAAGGGGMMSDQIGPGFEAGVDGPIPFTATTEKRTALLGPFPGVVTWHPTVVVQTVVEIRSPVAALVMVRSYSVIGELLN